MRTCTPSLALVAKSGRVLRLRGRTATGAVCHMFEKYQHLSLCSERFPSLQEALERFLVWSGAEEPRAAAPVLGWDAAALPFPCTPRLSDANYFIVLKFWSRFCLLIRWERLCTMCCWITSHSMKSLPLFHPEECPLILNVRFKELENTLVFDIRPIKINL